MRQYTSMGELGYIAMCKRQAVDYIKADYPRFAVLCVKRFVYFWAGPPRLAQVLVVGAGEKFAVPGVFSTRVLGIGTRPPPAQTRRVASVLADPFVSGDLLCGLSGPALPASDRAGDDDPRSLFADRSRQEECDPRPALLEHQWHPRTALSELLFRANQFCANQWQFSTEIERMADRWNSLQAWSYPTRDRREPRDRSGELNKSYHPGPA